MKFTLRKEQILADIFPPAHWIKFFPASKSPGTGKRLNARKYIGVLKLNPQEIQKQMRDEWD